MPKRALTDVGVDHSVRDDRWRSRGSFIPQTSSGTCSQDGYSAKADLVPAQPFGANVIQLNTFADQVIVAHELGHVILNDTGHTAPENSLMCGLPFACDADQDSHHEELTEAECNRARSNAVFRSARYFNYFVNQGRAEPPPEPPPEPLLTFPRAPNPDLVAGPHRGEVCCLLDDFNQRVPPGVCVIAGGKTSAICTDCCLEVDLASESFDYVTRDFGECTAEPVAMSLCEPVCCDLGDGANPISSTKGRCENLLGGTVVNCAPR